MVDAEWLDVSNILYCYKQPLQETFHFISFHSLWKTSFETNIKHWTLNTKLTEIISINVLIDSHCHCCLKVMRFFRFIEPNHTVTFNCLPMWWLIRIEWFNHFNILFSCYREKEKKTKNFSEKKSCRSNSSAPGGYRVNAKMERKSGRKIVAMNEPQNGSTYTFSTGNWWLIFLFSRLIFTFFSCVLLFLLLLVFFNFEVQLMRCIYLIVCALSHGYTVIDIIFKNRLR